jgi:hypothetical protein
MSIIDPALIISMVIAPILPSWSSRSGSMSASGRIPSAEHHINTALDVRSCAFIDHQAARASPSDAITLSTIALTASRTCGSAGNARRRRLPEPAVETSYDGRSSTSGLARDDADSDAQHVLCCIHGFVLCCGHCRHRGG